MTERERPTEAKNRKREREKVLVEDEPKRISVTKLQ